jgi:hypothetical protein
MNDEPIQSKIYRVEMFVPCVEAFVYEVEANSEEDALNLVITSSPDPVEYDTTEHNEDKAEIYIKEV